MSFGTSEEEPSVQLLRLGAPGSERPAVRTVDGVVHDLRPITSDIDGAFLARDGVAQVRAALQAGELPVLEQTDERVGPPLAGIGKIICIGLNYSDHAEETGAAVPAEPVLFLKTPDTVVGPYDEVLVPRRSVKTDWEVELGVVIGSTARYLDSHEQALACVAGYVISHDVSEREFQIERGGQWSKGKSAETFNPAGPWVATPDEIKDVNALDMWLDVNGERRQTGNTSTMVFDPFVIVHYLSQFMVLEPGDLIDTGTPPGVGMGFQPPRYLNPGDVVELGIEGLGVQRQQIVAAR
jgi:2-keto-4-pentenoate hydratase/2-oxohepta-3-ene-1,7-dioic acid hydratase in catechol pathway